jgi:hypothetical protein
MAMSMMEMPNAREDEVEEINRLRRQLADAQQTVDRIEARMADEKRRKADAEALRRLDAERRARERRELNG